MIDTGAQGPKKLKQDCPCIQKSHSAVTPVLIHCCHLEISPPRSLGTLDTEVRAPLSRASPLSFLLGQPGCSGLCRGGVERGTSPAHSRHTRARTHLPCRLGV